MERECQECGGPMVETEPDPDDLWFGEPAGQVLHCPTCGTLEADADDDLLAVVN